jgi:hypothetical protein
MWHLLFAVRLAGYPDPTGGSGGFFPVFRLMGLLIAAAGFLHAAHPRKMTRYNYRRRGTLGDVDGQIEPSRMQLMWGRVVGVVVGVMGLAFAPGIIF